MKNILLYADSLSWGIVPLTRERLPFEQRWPGVMELLLNAAGANVRVHENCINGRRTVWDDPYKAGRNGLVGLAQVMEMHAPLDLVILLLGTNDFQFNQPFMTPALSALGTARLVQEIRQAPMEPGMPVPPVLIVSPPPMSEPKGTVATKFAGAEVRSRGLAEAQREVAEQLGCAYFDAGSVTPSSTLDGIHLDAPQQRALGAALAKVVAGLLSV